MTQPVTADVSTLLAQLAAARDEVAQMAAKSRALRKQMLAEGVAQDAQVAQARGHSDKAQALLDEAQRLQGQTLDIKA